MAILALAMTSCATIPTPQNASDAVLMLRKYDAWAWAVGIALIWADLVLPVPQTVVIAALGIIYGTVLGGLLGSVGLTRMFDLLVRQQLARTPRGRPVRATSVDWGTSTVAK